ncbi:hypothetical protein VNO77_39424 [Canavalia gladiata]|uniref:Uncharacterized protein n=1 Tax=Canavalia gladiata TaxID=3824 RepID=A0AAN9PX43_CANGL
MFLSMWALHGSCMDEYSLMHGVLIHGYNINSFDVLHGLIWPFKWIYALEQFNLKHPMWVLVSFLASEICFPEITADFKGTGEPSLDSHARYEIDNSCNDLPTPRLYTIMDTWIIGTYVEIIINSLSLEVDKLADEGATSHVQDQEFHSL